MTSRAYRRHQNNRIIAKRKRIIKYIWQMEDFAFTDEKTGMLRKHNLTCGCWMCNKHAMKGGRIKTMQEVRQDQIDREEMAA